MLEVQKYLQTNELESLTQDFGIKVNEYDDRVVLNYCQIESPKHNPIARECRALILSKPDYKVLSRAFDRFYNYGEDPDTDDFDISKATVFDKVDGSLISVYHDGKEWQCSTRSMAFAEGPTRFKDKNLKAFTFRDIFKQSLGEDIDTLFSKINARTDYTYLFELVSPMSRVVTPYPETKHYLLGYRNKISGEEFEPFEDLAKFLNAETPKRYTFDSWDHIQSGIKNLPAMEEGYICADYSKNKVWRIKVKNPAWLAISHIRGNGEISTKRISILVWGNDESEYLSYFPEDQEFFDPYIEARSKMFKEIEHLKQFLSIEDQKEFAMKVKDSPVFSFLFNLKKGKSVSETMDKAFDSTKEKILNQYLD